MGLPDFVIESLSIALKMQSSQAAALLTQNQKFLVHICVKGMKGKDYSKLKVWYKLLLKQIPNFVIQCERDIQQSNGASINKAFNVIKCGMTSHNLTVSQLCVDFFIKLW